MFQTLLGDKVLIEKEEEKSEEMEQRPSGLYVPPSQEGEDRRSKKGTVVQAGVDCKHVQAGQDIMYDKMASTTLTIDDIEYVITNESSVLGIF